MIAGPLALLLAGVLAALATRQAAEAVIVRRAGGSEAPVRAFRHLPMPDATSRWWVLVAALLGWILGGPVAAGVGAVGAIGVSTVARRRRSARFATKVDEQLGDAVRAIAAGLRAGLSVAQSIAYAAEEGEPPLSTAFRRVADGVSLGEGLDRTLDRWASEVGTDDARLVVGVLALHRKSGGDLPRVLDQVAQTLRERASAAQEVRALTAQARSSACCRSGSSRSSG
jgi:Flp pilus assembly protein TadB